MKRKQLVWFWMLAAVLLALMMNNLKERSGGSKGAVRFDSGHRKVMGTFARIVCVAEDLEAAKKCAEAAFKEFELVDNLMSSYKADSQLSRLNSRGYGDGMKVGEELFEVLRRAKEFSELSQGAFDVTVGALIELWRQKDKDNSLPSDEELAEAQSRVGYEKLILDVKTRIVRFEVDGMKLDLGGIAKGYAIDRAVEAMKAAGATGGMADIGGDIRCFGQAGDREHWAIGLQNPKDADEISEARASMALRLTDNAVATSGDYRRYALIDGKKYSHIIDTKKGAGAKGLSSVTIIGESALDADALATAVSVLGAKKGLELIESQQTVEAILITSSPEFKMIKSTNADEYILQE